MQVCGIVRKRKVASTSESPQPVHILIDSTITGFPVHRVGQRGGGGGSVTRLSQGGNDGSDSHARSPHPDTNLHTLITSQAVVDVYKPIAN
jgi:hypothetical protein